MNNNRSIVIGVVILSIVAIAVVVLAVSKMNAAEPIPTITNTSAPSATHTPDPCSQDNITASVEAFEKTSREFDDLISIARGTANPQLAPIISELQKNRRIVDDYAVPSCMDTLKADLLGYMNAYIEYYLALYSSVSVAGGSTTQQQFDESMASLSAQANQQYSQVIDFANKFIIEKARLLGLTPPATIPPILPEGTPGTPPAQ